MGNFDRMRLSDVEKEGFLTGLTVAVEKPSPENRENWKFSVSVPSLELEMHVLKETVSNSTAKAMGVVIAERASLDFEEITKVLELKVVAAYEAAIKEET